MPSAAELQRMTDEQVIQQIVNSEQWGNSALAEIHRRSGERLTCAVNGFKAASKAQGNRMLCLTVVILLIAVVQLAVAAIGCYSSPATRASGPMVPASASTPSSPEAAPPATDDAPGASPEGPAAMTEAPATEREPAVAEPLGQRP